MEEIFDVSDDNGFPTGQQVTRSEAHNKGIPHRTAHTWILRKSGDSYQVLLQKRSANKESFPSMFHLDMNMYGTLDSIVGANTEDSEFYEYITEDISPENVSETDANAAFISLIELLRSDHVLEPSMLQNYQMFQLIAGYCDLAKDMDLELVEKFLGMIGDNEILEMKAQVLRFPNGLGKGEE
ncbi:NUDIX hydrolase [Butyrivibrio sp. AD3002]|uniref:NUDIX hydrolase n=1 Tax=Butyrivibrio sp. AD3002 TaxID=1280670 RepID=UPI0003B5E7FB|nr:NUDIX hydrolase [Butyrivibrio sp. AD3002]